MIFFNNIRRCGESLSFALITNIDTFLSLVTIFSYEYHRWLPVIHAPNVYNEVSLPLSLSLSFIAVNFIKRIMDTFVIRDEATPRSCEAAEAGRDARAREMNVIV